MTTTPTPTPSPTPSPIPLAEGEIPLSEEYFPDKAFRELLSALVDNDKNGILTLSEREQLTELRNTRYDMEQSDTEEYYYVHDPRTEEEEIMYYWLNRATSLEGIEYFPKLRLLVVDEGWERDELYCEEEHRHLESFYAENMPELESVQIMSKTKAVTIINAPKLRYLYLEPNRSIEACTITLKDCDSVEIFEYKTNAASTFDFRLENLRKLILFISEDVFCSQVEHAFGFSSLENLWMEIQGRDKDIVVKNAPKLDRLQIKCDNNVIISNLDALKILALSNVSGIEIDHCDHITSISFNNIMNFESIDLSALKKLDTIYCDRSAIQHLSLDSPYIDIRTFDKRIDIDFNNDADILSLRGISDTDALSADIQYKPVTISGVTECDCTGNTGYAVDLDGDGVLEELYSDETGFYINGVNQGLARHKYKYDTQVWNRFYLVDADRMDGKINLILNAECLDYIYAMHNGKIDLAKLHANQYNCFGQYLATYDGSLRLIGYAQTKAISPDRMAGTASFSEAVYDGMGGIRFSAGEGDDFYFLGARNGVFTPYAQEIELVVAEDGMVEAEPGNL